MEATAVDPATWDDLLRVSIDAFYDGRLAEGRLACDRLLNLPDLPANVRSITRANQIFYAPMLAELAPGLREAPLDVPVRAGWARFNPTVAADGDEWLVLLRTSNYRFEPPDTYIVTDAGPNVRTAYLQVRCDADLRPIGGPHPVADLTDAGRFAFKVQDYEDCRLVRLDSRWVASAMARDRNPDGVCQVGLLDFDPAASTFSNLRLLSPGAPGLHEKNWMPVVNDGALALVYSLAPTAILACDSDSGGVDLTQCQDAPRLARDLRGGSQLVAVDGGWLCLVHDVISRDGGDKIYLHRFVRFDDAFRITDLSHPFRFRATSIEFAAGLARRGETLALAYGVDDREAWIADLPLAEALALVRPVADLAPNGLCPLPIPPGLLAILEWQERREQPAAANSDLAALRPDDVIAAPRGETGASDVDDAVGFTPFPPAPPRLVSVTLAGDGNAGIIGDALRSVVDWVDACIVLDTGIADDTLEVARAVAGDKLNVRSFPWIDDFAAARNAALAAAADSGAEWVVILDTDERIDRRDFDIRASLAGADADVLLVAHVDGTYAKERFFRLPARGRFHGPTHEAFLADGRRGELAGPVFREAPKSADGYRRKAERDVAILTRHTAEHPDDARWFYYLGDSLANLHRTEEAIAAFERCWALKGWDEEGAWAMYRAARCWLDLGQRDRAIEACAAGMARHAGLAELPWLAAFACWQAGRFTQAVYWARLATTMGRAFGAGADVPRIGFRHPPALYEGPYDVLRFALRRLGDDAGADAAEQRYQQALAMRLGQSAPAAVASPRVDSGATRSGSRLGAPYLDALDALQTLVRPRAYLEIGVEFGHSLKLARCPAIGVDPEPRVPPEIFRRDPPPMLYRMTSDAFFAAHRREDLLGDGRLDLAFIDGLHLFEQVLRDFANVEAWSAPDGVIVIHDVIPPDVGWASRTPRRAWWTGDVWRVVPCLATYRPDLTTWLISAEEAGPSGLLLVTGLDPGNRALHDRRAAIEAEFLAGDPDDPAPLRTYLASLACTPLDTALAALATRRAVGR
jgi:tetratricopeptide (TPR) repeat protein